MRKKGLILFLVTILIICSAVGCKDDKGQVSGEKGSKDTPSVSSEDKEKKKENFNETGYPIVDTPITVTAMHTDHPVEGDPKEMAYWKKLEEVTNIHIEWERVPIDGNAIQLFYAAGEFPDFFHSTVNADRQYTYGVEGKVFVDYSELMHEYMPNMVSWFKEFPEAEKAIRQVNGEVYTLPRIQKASTSATGQMFYRTDYLDKVGLKAPTTIDEFYNTLIAIKEADLTKGYAPLLPYSEGHLDTQTEPFLFAAFGESTEPNFGDDGTGKVVYNRTSEQYRLYLEFMHKLYKEGLLENEFFTLDTAITAARIKDGQAAFMSYAANLLEEDFEDGNIHLDCLAPLTSEYTNTKKVMGYPYVSSEGGAINKECKYVKELLRMFDINYAREEVVPGSGLHGVSQAIGLEGENWEYTNADKTAYTLKGVPEDWTESTWDYFTKHVAWNQYYSAHILMATSGTGNNLARELGMLNNNIPYAVPRFPEALMKYTAEEKNQITNKQVDIHQYAIQARAQFITGVESLDNWDKYVKEIEAMGIEDVLKVKQASYDRWNEK